MLVGDDDATDGLAANLKKKKTLALDLPSRVKFDCAQTRR